MADTVSTAAFPPLACNPDYQEGHFLAVRDLNRDGWRDRVRVNVQDLQVKVAYGKGVDQFHPEVTRLTAASLASMPGMKLFGLPLSDYFSLPLRPELSRWLEAGAGVVTPEPWLSGILGMSFEIKAGTDPSCLQLGLRISGVGANLRRDLLLPAPPSPREEANPYLAKLQELCENPYRKDAACRASSAKPEEGLPVNPYRSDPSLPRKRGAKAPVKFPVDNPYR